MQSDSRFSILRNPGPPPVEAAAFVQASEAAQGRAPPRERSARFHDAAAGSAASATRAVPAPTGGWVQRIGWTGLERNQSGRR